MSNILIQLVVIFFVLRSGNSSVVGASGAYSSHCHVRVCVCLFSNFNWIDFDLRLCSRVMAWFAHLNNFFQHSSQARTNLSMTDCLSAWLFHLCNKSCSDLSEIQRMRLPKLCSLTRLVLVHVLASVHLVQFMAWPICHTANNNCTVFTLSFPVCKVAALLLCLCSSNTRHQHEF